MYSKNRVQRIHTPSIDSLNHNASKTLDPVEYTKTQLDQTIGILKAQIYYFKSTSIYTGRAFEIKSYQVTVTLREKKKKN